MFYDRMIWSDGSFNVPSIRRKRHVCYDLEVLEIAIHLEVVKLHKHVFHWTAYELCKISNKPR